jgi:dTDP-4-amino-4,6-dideoxygalactose transaminase
MGVSLYGNPCNIVALQEIADRHGIALLEDNCQSDGVGYRGKRLGSYGDVAVFSTNLMKFISTGDGGFIATNRDDIYEFAVMYTGSKTFPARKRHMNLSVPTIPFTTLRMNELTGAVALAQLQRLDWLLGRLRQARDQIFAQVGEGKSFRRVPGNDPEGDAGWLTPLLFPSEDACQAFATAVRTQGVHHVSTSKESFAGGEIYHCYPVVANEQFIPKGGAHWGTNFHAMVEKKSADPRFNPWTHPLYDGNVNYPKGFMDESFAVINRIAMIQTNPRLEPEHCKVIAGAIRTADDEVARLLRRPGGPV